MVRTALYDVSSGIARAGLPDFQASPARGHGKAVLFPARGLVVALMASPGLVLRAASSSGSRGSDGDDLAAQRAAWCHLVRSHPPYHKRSSSASCPTSWSSRSSAVRHYGWDILPVIQSAEPIATAHGCGLAPGTGDGPDVSPEVLRILQPWRLVRRDGCGSKPTEYGFDNKRLTAPSSGARVSASPLLEQVFLMKRQFRLIDQFADWWWEPTTPGVSPSAHWRW